jgi:hypothetical protein
MEDNMSKREQKADELRKKHSSWSCGYWNAYNISITQALKILGSLEGRKKNARSNK